MYKEPNHPMVYDFVGRLELTVPLFFGYNGVLKERLDQNLKKAGELSLQLQSVCGDMPYGGRSSLFLFNEAALAAVYEYETRRYQALGESEKAGKFKAVARFSVSSLKGWLSFTNSHVKNHYPPDLGIGCEDYACFLKYMISVASYSYHAYLYADDSIQPISCPAERGDFILHTAPDFHKIMASFKDYSLELETDADFHYDANGLGRIHRSNAPTSLCLSMPFVKQTAYRTEEQNPFDLSICPFQEENGVLFSGAQEGGIPAAMSRRPRRSCAFLSPAGC